MFEQLYSNIGQWLCWIHENFYSEVCVLYMLSLQLCFFLGGGGLENLIFLQA